MSLEVDRLTRASARVPTWIGTVSTETLIPILRADKTPIFVGSVYIIATGPSTVKGTSTDHWRISIEKASITSGVPEKLTNPLRTYLQPLRPIFWTEEAINRVLQQETLFVRLFPVGSPSAMVGVALTFEAEVR